MIGILSSSFSTTETETVAFVATSLGGIASVLFLASRFSANSLDVGALANFVLKQVYRVKVLRSGLKEKSVEIQIPTRLLLGFASHKTVRAHYLEREAATGLGDGAKRPRMDLLIIPGFTAHASTHMADLVWRMRPPPEWRVIVMELPLHNRNVGNFDGEFPDCVGIFEYTAAFAKAVAMGEGGTPLCLCGYSLGGNVCMRYLHERPAEVSKVILIAPGFAETLDDDFKRIGKENPQLVHAWQTLEELRGFCTLVGFPLCHPANLDFFQRGVHRERQEVYGKHKNFFVEYWAALIKEGVTKKGQEESPLRESLLRRVQTPVLLVTGQKDDCVNSDSCRTYIRDVIGEKRCTFHELPDTGHYGGLSDGWTPDGNIMYGSAPICADFLFGG